MDLIITHLCCARHWRDHYNNSKNN